jgi:biopolymer transport protein ExbB
LFSFLQAAGWPVVPLLLCSVVAIVLAVERLMALRTERVVPPKLLEEVLNVTSSALPSSDIVKKLADNSLLGMVLAEGIRAVSLDARLTEAQLRQVFETGGRRAIHQMERYLNGLGTVATAAPLLGLLGTVIGMIELFGAQGGGNDPAQLAHGISVALYNTAFGLIVAIPSLMTHRYFKGVVEGYTVSMEEAAERMVPQLMRFCIAR